MRDIYREYTAEQGFSREEAGKALNTKAKMIANTVNSWRNLSNEGVLKALGVNDEDDFDVVVTKLKELPERVVAEEGVRKIIFGKNHEHDGSPEHLSDHVRIMANAVLVWLNA